MIRLVCLRFLVQTSAMIRRWSHNVVAVLLGFAFVLSVTLTASQAAAMSAQMATMPGMEMGVEHDCGGCTGDQDQGDMKNGMCAQLCAAVLAAILPPEPGPVRADAVVRTAVAQPVQLGWVAAPDPSPPKF